jgi:phosphopantetheinyl transferase
MPLFYQQDFHGEARLAVWHIQEEESFFLREVPLDQPITHPHKRLQHLAGRLLLKHLYPDFPYDLIRIADTRKPFLLNEKYHFSISHCGDYAAAIVSPYQRVGIDLEKVHPKVEKVMFKFLNEWELSLLKEKVRMLQVTLAWSAKESVFKWYGSGQVDFREHIQLHELPVGPEGKFSGEFRKEEHRLFIINYHYFHDLCLSWVRTTL